jgi:hypothetical protein
MVMPRAGILGRECAAALAGGINIMLWHDVTSGICQLQVLAIGPLHEVLSRVSQLPLGSYKLPVPSQICKSQLHRAGHSCPGS